MTEVVGGMGVPLVQDRKAIQVRDPHQKQVTKLETWNRGQELKKIQNKESGWAKISEKRREEGLCSDSAVTSGLAVRVKRPAGSGVRRWGTSPLPSLVPISVQGPLVVLALPPIGWWSCPVVQERLRRAPGPRHPVRGVGTQGGPLFLGKVRGCGP